MSLTAIRTVESARRKFFMGSGGRNESKCHQDARIGEKKIFMNSTYIMSKK